MFRRCLTFLLIAAFLAGQLAAVGCAHAGMSALQQEQHDARPHFHWGGGWAAHTHGSAQQAHAQQQADAQAEHAQQHAYAEHDHPHDRRSNGRSDQLRRPASPGGLMGYHHDEDAVYLAAGHSVCAPLSKPKDAEPTAATTFGYAADAAFPGGLIHLSTLPIGYAALPPGPGASGGSKLYLTLRNLRI